VTEDLRLSQFQQLFYRPFVDISGEHGQLRPAKLSQALDRHADAVKLAINPCQSVAFALADIAVPDHIPEAVRCNVLHLAKVPRDPEEVILDQIDHHSRVHIERSVIIIHFERPI